jgi:hypothetical protein
LIKQYNINLVKVLRLAREMIILADEGDEHRMDKSCGVLYGILRDTAYKIRSLAEKEKIIHIGSGIWEEDINNEINNLVTNDRRGSEDYA